MNDFKQALHLSTVVDGEQDTDSLIKVRHVGVGYSLNSCIILHGSNKNPVND